MSVVKGKLSSSALKYYGRFFFSPKDNRWLGIHNPFGSKMGKAADPYINGLTLQRLLYNRDPVVRAVAGINVLERKARLAETETTRLRRFFRFVSLRPNFEKLVVVDNVEKWIDPNGKEVDPLPYIRRLRRLIFIAGIKDWKGIRLICKAFTLAWEGHAGKLRKDNETPFFDHPLTGAEIFVPEGKGMGAEELAATIVHDLIETGKINEQSITRKFLETHLNERVADIAEGLTELGQEPGYKGRRPSLVDVWKKILRHGKKDLAILAIKIRGDRKHNMRTLDPVSPESRIEKAQETLDVYSRLADALGMWEDKRELEDLSFKYLELEKYQEIESKRAEIIKKSEQKIRGTVREMERNLAKSGLKAKIIVEQRFIYELHQRMEKRGISRVEELFPHDIWRINIVVPNGADCYSMQGWLHNQYIPDQTEIRDHIAEPRPNGHKFLQSYVEIPKFGRLLVQIRDKKMYDNYRFGILSQIGVKGREKPWYKETQTWLEAVLSFLREEGVSEREAVRFIAAHSDPIVVKTHKGKPIRLPFGATVLDFAREIHERIFLRARGAIVNGREANITQILRDGDMVYVKTDEDAYPALEWMDHVQTPEARYTLRKYLSARDERIIHRDAMTALGKECKRFHLTAGGLLGSALFRKYVSAFSFSALEETGKDLRKAETAYRLLRKRYSRLERKINDLNAEEYDEASRRLAVSKGEIEDLRQEIRGKRDRFVRMKRGEFLREIGIGERSAKEAVSQVHDLFLRELRRQKDKRQKLAPYYLAIEITNRKGIIYSLSSKLSEMGFNIRDIFPVCSKDEEGEEDILVLGVDVFGGERGGKLIGQIQRLQVRTIAQSLSKKGREKTIVRVLKPQDVARYLELKTQSVPLF